MSNMQLTCGITFKVKLNTDIFYIVTDKPKHLPPPRTIVHTSRSTKVTKLNSVPPIGAILLIPHGSEYNAALRMEEFNHYNSSYQWPIKQTYTW